MKNKIIITAILILCIVITSKIVSDNSVEKTNFITTPNNQNKYSNQQVDFDAAEKSIETVVHIKSNFSLIIFTDIMTH